MLMRQILLSPVSTQESGERYNFARSLLDCLDKGVIVIGPLRQILSLNRTAELQTGLHAESVTNRSLALLPAPLQAVIDETLVTGRAVQSREIQLTEGPSPEALLRVSTTITLLENGAAGCVLAELQNVSQARGIEQNLEHLDRLASIGILSAGVAHEIKNALVSVRTFSELLAPSCDDAELAQLVPKEIKRIDDVVRLMLRGATREEFRMEPLSIHHLLKDSLALLRHQMAGQGIALDLSLEASTDLIRGDERQLRQSLMNLLMNALEAMEGFGRLTVATETASIWSKPHLKLSIQDTGPGIRPENLSRLFSPFFTTKRDGTGLGLAITRRIIQEHSGAITVESKMGQGTRFQIILPLI